MRAWADASIVLAAKLAASTAVLAAGFRAISDDDFARITIAQRFAEAPSLDPSGTSWLPLPFWVYGSAFAVFGNGLEVARYVAVALGLVGALAVWFAARLLGLGRVAAISAGVLAAVFPYSAYLGAAAVPEAPASALVVLGAATLARGPWLRLLGAAALGAACASRYEPWPAAIAFAGFTLVEAIRTRELRLYASAALAVAFPLAWLAHGLFVHHDALFFLARVAEYKAALGPEQPIALRLVRAPLGLLKEPELVLGCLLLGGLVLGLGSGRAAPTTTGTRALLRGSACIAASFVVLVLGDLLGGAPTHHGERTLLAVWLWTALVAAFLAEQLLLDRSRRREVRLALLGSVVLATLLLGALVRPRFPRDAFASRNAEVDLGLRARSRHIPRLAIAASDYGYFAVEASFGSPSATLIIDDHDPRRARSRDLLAEQPAELARRLTSQGVHWLALPLSRRATVKSIADERDRNERWALVELRR